MLEITGLFYYQACPVCREPYGKMMKAACYHVMCSECVGDVLGRRTRGVALVDPVSPKHASSLQTELCVIGARNGCGVKFFSDVPTIPIALLNKSLGHPKRCD
jgi:hypothetical protein